jgi:hypothetical protein
MIMGHWLVTRSHDQWRKGHEFHAEVTDRNRAMERAGFLRLLGGRMEQPVPPELVTAPSRPLANPGRRTRGIKIPDEQDGNGHVRP